MRRFEQVDYSHLRRFDLQEDAGGGILVLAEDGEGTGPFDAIEKAFAFILEHEGRVRLSWSRTVIAGEARPFDFSGRFRTDNAGRITKESDGLSAGKWQSFPAAFNPKTGRLSGTMGVHETRDAAVAWIERKYTETMSGRFETLG